MQEGEDIPERIRIGLGRVDLHEEGRARCLRLPEVLGIQCLLQAVRIGIGVGNMGNQVFISLSGITLTKTTTAIQGTSITGR